MLARRLDRPLHAQGRHPTAVASACCSWSRSAACSPSTPCPAAPARQRSSASVVRDGHRRAAGHSRSRARSLTERGARGGTRQQVPPQYDFTPERGRSRRRPAGSTPSTSWSTRSTRRSTRILTDEARQSRSARRSPTCRPRRKDTLAGAWTPTRGRRSATRCRADPRRQRSGPRCATRCCRDVRSSHPEPGQRAPRPSPARARRRADRATRRRQLDVRRARPPSARATRRRTWSRRSPCRSSQRRDHRPERGTALGRRPQAIETLGLGQARRSTRPSLAGWFLLAALTVALLLAWIWRFRPKIWHRNNALLLIGLLVIGTAARAEGHRRPRRCCRTSCRPRPSGCCSPCCSTPARR